MIILLIKYTPKYFAYIVFIGILQKKDMAAIDYNAQYWKSKSVKRNAENKELKKRIKELTNSRDSWKEKYKRKRDASDLLSKEIGAIKKKIEKILNY